MPRQELADAVYRMVGDTVQPVLDAVSRLLPQEKPISAFARSSVLQIDLGKGRVLLGLRRLLSPQILNSLPAPLGFQSSRRAGWSRGGQQHDMGPDGGPATHYGTGATLPGPVTSM